MSTSTASSVNDVATQQKKKRKLNYHRITKNNLHEKRVIKAKKLAKEYNFPLKNIIVKDPTERNAVLKSHYNMLGIRYVIRDNKCRCKTASCQGEVGYWGDVGFGFVLKTIIPHTCIHVCDDDADLNTGVDSNNDSGNDDTGMSKTIMKMMNLLSSC